MKQLTLEVIWDRMSVFFYPGIRPEDVLAMVLSYRQYEMKRVVSHE